MAYVYLRSEATGQHLGAADDGAVALQEHTGDSEMWSLVSRDTAAIGSREALEWEYTLMSPVSDVVLTATAVEPLRPPHDGHGEQGIALHVALNGDAVDDDGATGGAAAGVFTALTGPTRLPSAYVADMNETGYSIIDGIMQPDDIAALKQTAEEIKANGGNAYRGAGGGAQKARAEPDEGRWGLDNNLMLANSPIIGKCSFHPVAMWVIQQYLGVADICQSHIPSYTILKPAKKLIGERPPGGWHSVSAAAALFLGLLRRLTNGRRITRIAKAASSTTSGQTRRGLVFSTTSVWTSSHLTTEPRSSCRTCSSSSIFTFSRSSKRSCA